MNVSVAGASGATGRVAVDKLLSLGIEVSAVARSFSPLPDKYKVLKVTSAVHSLDRAGMKRHANSCDAVVSCLGHSLTCKGVFGKPCVLLAILLNA